MPQRWNARELNCYSHEEGRHLHIGNRLFYEDPDERVEPSARVVVASDAWARDLARRTLSGNTPTTFCDTGGRCSPVLELRPSRDMVSDPAGHPRMGRPESVNPWLRNNPAIAAINGRTAHGCSWPYASSPRCLASWLAEVVGDSLTGLRRHLRRFVETGLVAAFYGRATRPNWA